MKTKPSTYKKIEVAFMTEAGGEYFLDYVEEFSSKKQALKALSEYMKDLIRDIIVSECDATESGLSLTKEKVFDTLKTDWISLVRKVHDVVLYTPTSEEWDESDFYFSGLDVSIPISEWPGIDQVEVPIRKVLPPCEVPYLFDEAEAKKLIDRAFEVMEPQIEYAKSKVSQKEKVVRGIIELLGDEMNDAERELLKRMRRAARGRT